jgi:two-component SAPR family response regulator
MNKEGPIIIIEDDEDDQEVLLDIFKKFGYKNEIIFFSDGYKALDFLNETDLHPFLILSDINMPTINGFELRKKIFNIEALQLKCIPFLFFTTTSRKREVMDAYGMSVQGFFVKPDSIQKLEDTIRRIMEYWLECIAPNHFE